MKKGSTKQKRKEQYNKFTTFMYLTVCILGGLCFGFMAIQSWLVLQDSGGQYINEHKGTYDLYVKEYYRNSNYRFTLLNGDVLEIPCEYAMHDDMLEKLQGSEELFFRYYASKNPFRQTHDVISLVSESNNITFVDESYIEKKIQGAVGIYAFLSLCCGAPFFLWGVIIYSRKKSDKHR